MTPPVYATLYICMAVAFVATMWVTGRHMSTSRQGKMALTASKEYRGLADEYRRLSDMAITAQEHTDLRLTDISVRIDALRSQLDQMQRILNEVE
jgi:hypothetical protein